MHEVIPQQPLAAAYTSNAFGEAAILAQLALLFLAAMGVAATTVRFASVSTALGEATTAGRTRSTVTTIELTAGEPDRSFRSWRNFGDATMPSS